MRFSSNMLPFKGSLFLERQPIWFSFQNFWERDPPIFLLESRLNRQQQKLLKAACLTPILNGAPLTGHQHCKINKLAQKNLPDEISTREINF